MKGCVAAVTGGASGMGRELCKQLVQAGCSVAMCDVQEEGMAETLRECNEIAQRLPVASVKVTSHKVDVSNQAAVEAWAATVVEEHGKVNYVFNNAGVAAGGECDTISMDTFKWIFSINFWGVVYGTRAFLPYLKRQPVSTPAHIVNTSSVFGMVGVPLNGPYCATKFAVRGFTEALRSEMQFCRERHIDVSCVHPGGIKTAIARNARADQETFELYGIAARMQGVADGTVMTKDQMTAKFETNFITTAADASKEILDGVRAKKYRIMVGPDARMLEWLLMFLPVKWWWVLSQFITRPKVAAAGALGLGALNVLLLFKFVKWVLDVRRRLQLVA